MRNQKRLLVEQLDRKLKPFAKAVNVEIPIKGWIHTIRTTLNMTLRQLGNKLEITSQGVKDMEERESTGSISIKSLKEVGKILEMHLVYAFVPIDGSIEKLIDTKAKKLARKIVLRTNQNMKLEDQGINNDYIRKAIDELAEEIKREMKKTLWD